MREENTVLDCALGLGGKETLWRWTGPVEQDIRREKTNLSKIIQGLLVNTVFFKSGCAVFDHIIHDALVHIALYWPSAFSICLPWREQSVLS